MKNQEKSLQNYDTNNRYVSMGCRLNALESEKIVRMLTMAGAKNTIVVNTCAVTQEAEKQSKQAIRKLARENPDATIFITGCGATRAVEEYAALPNVARVITNADKMNLSAYGLDFTPNTQFCETILPVSDLSKAFVQVQNGCNHKCTYCIVSQLRGKNVAFPYEQIVKDVKDAVADGFYEIVLTGVDIAGYVLSDENCGNMFLDNVCRRLLNDVPKLARLRLSSMDPASPATSRVCDLMAENPKMLSHLHLSMQSGSDTILRAMGRRHNADMVRRIAQNKISMSWDIICGFPGETEKLFNETLDLVRELKPIHIHAFPFSARPGTAAATMENQVPRDVARARVKIISDAAQKNRMEFMKTLIGTTAEILMENNNIGRNDDDIPVRVSGAPIPARTITQVKILGVNDDYLLA
ncbi:MAG: MiaB/RimO family radical SAM methylthiotransferase [Rickettsiales bacterium]|jgi:threonylcarbamoyladenosine tRNA methylthiotransferase MtaB|nr:MiaB/RimO family radical SAM methylthiotransferase [Rickettsiales bacterium]